MPNYMLNPQGVSGDRHPQRSRRRRVLLESGADAWARARCSSPTGRRCTKAFEHPECRRFYEQAQAFKSCCSPPRRTPEQQKDLDFLLEVGHLFSLIVYGQLILEQAALTG
jgi:acyl-CoA dehydrogenase